LFVFFSYNNWLIILKSFAYAILMGTDLKILKMYRQNIFL